MKEDAPEAIKANNMKDLNKTLHFETDVFKSKLKKLRERLNKGMLDAAKEEGSVASSYLSKGRNIEELVHHTLQGKTHKKSATVFGYFFIMVMILGVILTSFQLYNTVEAITDIKREDYSHRIWIHKA